MLRLSGLHRSRLVFAVLLSLLVAPASAQPRAIVPSHMPDEVIVEVEGSPKPQAIDTIAKEHHLGWIDSAHLDLANSTLYRLRILSGRSVNEVIRSLKREPIVKWVQQNFVFARPDVDAIAPLFQLPHHAFPQMNVVRQELDPAQYALPQLSILQAHHLAKGRSVVVAVMDSKIDHSHPDLAGVVDNVYEPGDRREPPHLHGTGVAGILAAQRRMGPLHLLGVAPEARILGFAVFGAANLGTTFTFARGFNTAVARDRAQVVNMSFAGPFDPLMARLFSIAAGRGVVLVAAAGNSGPNSPPLFPASDPRVIAVTAVDSGGKLFPHASRGRHVAVAAPGVDIALAAPHSRYAFSSGTSYAAAHISGIVALMLQANPKLSPADVRDLLTSSARRLGAREDYGAGLVDAYRVINLAARYRTAR